MYTEAIQTVDVQQAVGKPHALWVAFAKFYEENGQIAEVCCALLGECGHPSLPLAQ